MHAVDLDAEPQVLTGLVPGPFPPGLDQDGDRVGRLALDAFDAPAQLARGPQRVDQLEVVVGQQRRGERAHEAEHAAAGVRDAWRGAALSHGVPRERGLTDA